MRRPHAVIGALGVAALAAAALWPTPVLLVTAAPPARDVLRLPLRAPIEVRLDYVHSFERTPIAEIYRADPSGLRLVRMEFASQGAGLPSSGFVREGDRFVLRTDQPLETLPVRVSAIGRQRLRIAANTFHLVDVAGEGGVVTVSVRRAPRLPLLGGMLY